MLKNKSLAAVICLFIILCPSAYSQNKYLPSYDTESPSDSILFLQIKTDTLFNSNQVINILAIPAGLSDKYEIRISSSDSGLVRTSIFGENEGAFAAINGGFFNMDSGGGVTYLEIDDEVIDRRRNPELKWGIEDTVMNGALVVANNEEVIIESVKPSDLYEKSKFEKAVLVTGPMLLINSEKVKLPYMGFSYKRHPRTCLCTTEEYIVFVTIDGRSDEAEGMSLTEVQEFLLSLGCDDAINLDGGGSTTMWIRRRGIVNTPSDITGERPVANVILLIEK